MITFAVIYFFIVFKKSRPPTPPSPAATRRKESITQGMCKDFAILFTNVNFLLISAIYALMYTIYAGLGFVVGSLFAPFLYSGFDISLVGMVFVFVGTIAVLFCGIYLDRTNKYLFVLRMISVTSTLAMASSLLLIPTGNIWFALLFCVIGGACIIPIVPVCYALATEVTHPVQPAMVLGLLANFANFLLFVTDLFYISLLKS